MEVGHWMEGGHWMELGYWMEGSHWMEIGHWMEVGHCLSSCPLRASSSEDMLSGQSGWHRGCGSSLGRHGNINIGTIWLWLLFLLSFSHSSRCRGPLTPGHTPSERQQWRMALDMLKIVFCISS